MNNIFDIMNMLKETSYNKKRTHLKEKVRSLKVLRTSLLLRLVRFLFENQCYKQRYKQEDDYNKEWNIMFSHKSSPPLFL